MLEDGEIVEFGEPYILLQNTKAKLHRFVQQINSSERMLLLELAKQASQQRRKKHLDPNTFILENMHIDSQAKQLCYDNYSFTKL